MRAGVTGKEQGETAGEVGGKGGGGAGAAVWLWRWLAGAADLLLPPLCVACRTPVAGHGLLCGSCWRGVDFISRPLCDRLGLPLPYGDDGPHLSTAARAAPPAYDRARAVACYNDVMRELVHALKFRDRHEGLALFARWMQRAGAELLQDADMLVPVPLYRVRLWARRFNQSALLAERLARETGIAAHMTLLRRTRATRQQVGLSMRERHRNVADAFQVATGCKVRLAGRKVVLVDDVITTGATAEACARVLKAHGAARVDVLALARVVDPLRFDV